MTSKLPKIDKAELFLNKISEVYPKNYKKILSFLEQPKLESFRVNTLQVSENTAIEQLTKEGYKIKKGPFANSYYVDCEKRFLSDSELFKQGKIYIQAFSSMAAVLALEPKPHEQILDMCASPGSKTTQIATLTNNLSHITAVEKSKTRFFALKRNLSSQCVTCTDVKLADVVGFHKNNSFTFSFYDKILADVPCSNEAAISPVIPDTLKYWNNKKTKSLSSLQKRILESGVSMLKPGGVIVYSTCTFGVEENELVVDWVLHRYPSLEVLDIVLPIEEVVPGVVIWKGKNLNPQVKKCLRIVPTKLFTGFFIAKLQKR